MNNNGHYILTASCPGKLGTIDALTGFLAQQHCYILEMASYDDRDTDRFFVRIEFGGSERLNNDTDGFKTDLAERIAPFNMQWQLHDSERKLPVVIMVSKYDHCLNDLLYRSRTGKLPIEIRAIVSNHPNLKPLADWHQIPYHHLPITPETKQVQEQKLLQLVADSGAELVILARYMQVLSEQLCEHMQGRIINIHHSLLPGFKGAKPYHQAYEYGVKMVGATAHYVTPELDEGPIIDQIIEAVDHSFTIEQLVEKGQDTECMTLARAVKHHAEHRVFLNGRKTVVFR